MSAPPRILITGANRGVGLALAAEYLSRGWAVIATARDPDAASALNALGPERLTVEPLEVSDLAQIDDLGGRYATTPIEVVINNAGVFDTDPKLDEIDYEAWRHVLEVNLLAPMRVAAALRPALRLGSQKKLVTLTSATASIGLNDDGGRYLYRSSKAAMNMAMRSLAHELRAEGLIVGVMSPGLVDTDMVRHIDRAKITPQASARAVADAIDRLTLEQSGIAMRFTGEPIPW